MRGLLSPVRAAEKYGSKLVRSMGNLFHQQKDDGTYEPRFQNFGVTDEDIAADNAANASLLNTTGGKVGNIVGEGLAAAIPTGSMYNAGRAAIYGGSKLFPKVLASAGSGAASGAAGSVMTGNDDAGDMALAAGAGGVLSPIMHGVSKGASVGWDWAKKHPYSPAKIVTQYLQEQAQGNPSGAVAALRNLSSDIGERLTAGRAAVADDSAYPWLKVLDEDVTLGRQAGVSNQIEQGNRDIRSNILRDIEAPGVRPIDPVTGDRLPSKIGEDIAESRKLYYDTSMNDPVVMTPDLINSLGGSLVTPADRIAGKINRQQDLVATMLGNRTPGVSQPGGQVVIGSQNTSNPGITLSLPIESIRDMQTMKRALTSTSRRAKEEGLGGDIPINETRAALVDRMRRASPTFADAEDHFAGLSRLQNQSDYAGDLLTRLNPIQGAKQNYKSTISRMDDPNAFLAENKIQNIYDTPEALFANAPRKLDEIKALRRSLEREVKYGEIQGHKGLTDNLESGLTKAERAAPPLFTMAVTIPKRLARIAGSRQEEKAYDILDDLVLNPSKMADVLEEIPLNQRNATVNYLRNLSARKGNQIVGGTAGLTGYGIGENYAP
jgi:hypothetical protein